MSGASGEDRTEAATGRRLERARADGKVAVSTEVAPMLLLAALAAFVLMAAPAVMARFRGDLAGMLAVAGRLDGPGALGAALRGAGLASLRACLWIFALAIAAGVAATVLQTGFLFHGAAPLPDLARLSPRRGFSRVFGTANLIQAGKSVLKAIVIGAALWRLLRGRSAALIAAIVHPAGALPAQMGALAGAIILTALGAQAASATIDLVLVRLRHAKSLRMSRAEVKEEAKEANGNPEIKARIRRLRAQRARYRMTQSVRDATVVVTNPTHYAVALAYDRSRSAAPRVVAKGVDEMAARIRALAEEHRVPMVANPPLARALHRVELETDIPAELYQAVAELIAYVWRLQGKVRRPA